MAYGAAQEMAKRQKKKRVPKKSHTYKVTWYMTKLSLPGSGIINGTWLRDIYVEKNVP